MSFDKATIAAFVDGQLDDLTARRIEREAATNPALTAEIARLRTLTDRLQRHYGPFASETIPEELMRLLAPRGAATDTLDTSLAARREEKRVRFAPMHWGAVAASLVLGLTLGTQPWRPPADVAIVGETLVASGTLATALDTQLASNQPADAPIRISLSFRDRNGRTCRSFEGAVLAGIGCRVEDGWALERTMPGSRQADYRQASSGELAAAASAMMAGDPFDEAAENKGRANDWR